MKDSCQSCFWFRALRNEQLRKLVEKDGHCLVRPEPVPKNKGDFCGLHRPRRVGWELRLGDLLFRVEFKKMG
jgi:hypothetical protein